ncbi:MAG: UrcA family protein [Parvularcula sp.]
MRISRTIFAAIAAVGVIATPALGQERDRDAERDALTYEFEFSYDRDDLRDPAARADMDRRLRTEASEYCTQNMREHRAACRREVVRSARDDFDRIEQRRAEIYAAREE